MDQGKNIMAKRYILGFLAGVLAVLVFHQGMILVLNLIGMVPNPPWSMRLTVPLSVPAIVNSMFWGGIWGLVFVAVADRLPVGNDIARGAVFGLLGPWLLGNGVLVPLFKGGAYLFGLDPRRMLIGALIGAAFGVGLALFWRLLARRA